MWPERRCPPAAWRVASSLVMTELRQPGPARRWAVDAAIAVGVTAVAVVATHHAPSWHPDAAPAGPATYAALVVGGLALTARRRYPVSVLAITLASALWAGAGGRASFAWISLIVAFFTAVLARQRAAAVASLVVGYVASVWPPWLIGARGHVSAGSALGLAIFLLLLLSVAEVIRARSQRRAALEQSQAEELRRRAGEERMRIARDLHDVVAHNISVINVQANTALHLMDRQPERARSALTAINDVSKQALVELRSVLGVLRDVDETAPRAPSPGLARLPDLVASAQAAGLTVHVEEDVAAVGQPAQLPADVDVAAYRIVQEALTNSARHATGAAVTVRVRAAADEVTVEVTDDGAGRPPGRGGTPGSRAGAAGNGITGMAERAAALGGTLRAGPEPGGGFLVLARLPRQGGGR
jgi:signal transduction histidine kinase